jgi:hypothetical protein
VQSSLTVFAAKASIGGGRRWAAAMRGQVAFQPVEPKRSRNREGSTATGRPASKEDWPSRRRSPCCGRSRNLDKGDHEK